MRVFLAAALFSLATAQSCPDGFFSHGGSCYLIPVMASTWAEAKVYCQVVGADLAIIDSQDEENVLVNRLSLLGHAYKGRYFWLDGLDYIQEGKWIWSRTGQPISTAYWAQNQPDNVGSTQHCLAMDSGRTHQWADFACENHQPFICERSGAGSGPAPVTDPVNPVG